MTAAVRRRLAAAGAPDRGSLLLALLMTLMVTTLIVVTTATVITGLVKTRNAREYALAQQAADAAVNNALMQANQQQDLTGVPAARRTGTTGTVTWTWTATQAATGNTGEAYDLLVTATGAKVRRTFRILLGGVRVASADGTDGHVRYRVAPGGGFTVGFFADQEAVLRGSTVVDSYDSVSGKVNTGLGTLATNGTLTLDGAAKTDKITLWDTAALPYADRCVGAACATTPTRQEPIRYEVAGPTATQFIDTACQATGQPIRPWVASQNGGVLGTSGACYSSLLFDQNTTVPATPGNPVTVYVTGAITVTPGVTVNTTQAATTPAALSLIVYSRGTRVTLQGGPGPASRTRAAWALWAPNAECAGSPTVGYVDVFGAMLCGRLSTQGQWALHYDEQTRYLTADPTAKRVWSVVSYREG